MLERNGIVAWKENKKVNNQLIAFIRTEISEFDLPINEDTSIEEDLGVTGFEHEGLIRKYSKHFRVDISNFMFEEYIYPEPSPFLSWPENIKKLTVGHLEKGIIFGKLDNGVIGGEA